jgi:hypothetical protein
LSIVTLAADSTDPPPSHDADVAAVLIAEAIPLA